MSFFLKQRKKYPKRYLGKILYFFGLEGFLGQHQGRVESKTLGVEQEPGVKYQNVRASK